MSRFHVHVAVADLGEGIAFYNALFGTEPSVQKEDYAKWELTDPAVNFAISARGREPGVDHLGFQAADEAEQTHLAERARTADAAGLAEVGTTCCYAVSDKYWATDPAGVAWETFHSLGEAQLFHDPASSCCTPAAEEPASTGCCG
ncbi:Glyoxalase/Bleomycin resistance protein/Dioxygenase superfamily protein [Thiohalospira halophila DSM 15071]|uniref:Glyoxalase/Bleomycin resistance protein/Dioxygenase superfamily protein n=1 Tax=Thiohalospira halophila DSM 15071 TaxID=1123397 RepID=A0A1I1TIY1_9GAMM|nr:ArsI/CadI family heavy metal resistance metalloenzyme [Thiohalospira halophila]SFD58596.1 Glyoxalase/Bleomycin resistance protein/Dioxygenase superfamily protein [Thiohalospira halophila DSM 15071]